MITAVALLVRKSVRHEVKDEIDLDKVIINGKPFEVSLKNYVRYYNGFAGVVFSFR